MKGNKRISELQDVFTAPKNKRHSSEQKRKPQGNNSSTHVESSLIHSHANPISYNSASKPFEAAAKLGLMGSQDIPSLSGILSPIG